MLIHTSTVSGTELQSREFPALKRRALSYLLPTVLICWAIIVGKCLLHPRILMQ